MKEIIDFLTKSERTEGENAEKICDAGRNKEEEKMEKLEGKGGEGRWERRRKKAMKGIWVVT